MSLLGTDFAHEQLRVHRDPGTDLVIAIAIHSTALGPALGGLRLWAYPDVDAAVADALELARAMTFKAAAAGLDLGGGKATALDDGRWPERRAARMQAVGRLVESLGGAYITGPDIGTTVDDMDAIAACTPHVIGKSAAMGGAGDPSPVTARGVLGAIRAGLRVRTGSDGLAGRRVGVVGVGKVGRSLAAQLAAAGAEVVVSDVDAERARRCVDELGASVLPTADLLRAELDALAPCSLGGLIDEDAAGGLRVAVVAGAANNPLAHDGVANALAGRGILYVPDFVANCGGLIHVASEHDGFDPELVECRLAQAEARAAELLEEAERTGETPLRIAERRAAERVAGAAGAPRRTRAA